MAKTGGRRTGAGRKRGSPNRLTAEILTTALSQGITPVEYMLELMRDEKVNPAERLKAAQMAAPFCHPRPAPVPRTLEIDLPDISTTEGIKAAIAAIVTQVARGRLAPSEAQSITALIDIQRRVLETEELTQRVEALENAR